jgi:hypothetical protein
LQQGGANTGQDSRFGAFMRGPENIPRIGPDGQPAIAPNMGQVNRPGVFDRMRDPGGFVPPGQPMPQQGQGDNKLMAILQLLRARAGSR